MRLISEEDFYKYFPNAELGKGCYREISKYIIEYSPEEIDADGYTEYDDTILLYVKDYNEPISPQIVDSFLNYFKGELEHMEVLNLVLFTSIPVNYGVKCIQIKDIINNHKPVYQIAFDLMNLKYFAYFFDELSKNI